MDSVQKEKRAIDAAMYLRVCAGDGMMGEKGRNSEKIKHNIVTS